MRTVQRITAAVVSIDEAHRAVKTVEIILRLAPEILRGGASEGISVRLFHEREIAAEQARRSRWHEKRASLPRREGSFASIGIRSSVQQLVDLGPFPASEDASEEESEYIRTLLDGIEPPLTRREASALRVCVGPDDTWGLAWTLLHLICA